MEFTSNADSKAQLSFWIQDPIDGKRTQIGVWNRLANGWTRARVPFIVRPSSPAPFRLLELQLVASGPISNQVDDWFAVRFVDYIGQKCGPTGGEGADVEFEVEQTERRPKSQHNQSASFQNYTFFRNLPFTQQLVTNSFSSIQCNFSTPSPPPTDNPSRSKWSAWKWLLIVIVVLSVALAVGVFARNQKRCK